MGAALLVRDISDERQKFSVNVSQRDPSHHNDELWTPNLWDENNVFGGSPMKGMPRSRRSTTVIERFNHLMQELHGEKWSRNSFRLGNPKSFWRS
jgi:hypothetical protein